MFEERGDYFLNNQQLKKQLGVDVHPLQRYTNLSQAQVMESAKGWGPNAQAGLREMYLDQRKANVTGLSPEDTGTYGDFQAQNKGNAWERGKVRLHNTVNPDGTPNYDKRLTTVNHEANHFGNWTGSKGYTEDQYRAQTELATRIRQNSVNNKDIPGDDVVDGWMQRMIKQGGSVNYNWQEMRDNPNAVPNRNMAYSKEREYNKALAFENATAKYNFDNNPANKGKTYTPFVPRNHAFQLDIPNRQVPSNNGVDWSKL
jgi:hypothetical protein